MANKILEWKAHEFEHREKGSGWYLTFIILAVLLVIYEILIRDYFAAGTFIIIAFIVYFFARLNPREITVMITNKGIHIGNLHLPYATIKKFWIVSQGTTQALHLETTAYLNSSVVIQIADQDPEEIHTVLLQYVPEDHPNRETVGQRLARRLRF